MVVRVAVDVDSLRDVQRDLGQVERLGRRPGNDFLRPRDEHLHHAGRVGAFDLIERFPPPARRPGQHSLADCPSSLLLGGELLVKRHAR